MAWLRRRLAAWSIAPLGWLVIVSIPACAVLAFLGPKVTRTPALIVGLIVLFIVASEGAGMARFGAVRSSQRERRERLSGVGKRTPVVSAPAEADEAAWRAERERRERDSV